MDPNKRATIENFVKSMEKVGGIIKERNPDIIIAPMSGAIPFIDVLNIVDDEFPNHKVEYIPASNKVYRVSKVLRQVFGNLIEDKAPNDGSFLSIDEVVSGNSLMRVAKQFLNARMDHANKKTNEVYGVADFRDEKVRAYRDELVESIKYNTIGIVDSRMARKGKTKNPEYLKALEEGLVIPVNTDCIVTMDRTGFFPAMYKLDKDSEGKPIYLPVISDFNVSQEYIDFLTTVAGIVGKDPSTITVHNMGKIRNSYNWVPEEFRKV